MTRKTLTLLGKNANLYAQMDIPGTVDHLIDELKNKHNRPLPAADLLMTNVYELLMADVIDVKDLGSGVIGGLECDHLAFRTEDVDWQIWIAQGDRPYPCRYVITSKLIDGGPQYSIQVSDWKTGDEVAADDFSFKNSTMAKKIDRKDIPEMDDLPDAFYDRRCQMIMLKRVGFLLLAVTIWLGGLEFGASPGGYELKEQSSIPGISSFVPTAEARVGRPLTPVSVAGVARRTVRRCAVGVYNC